MLTHRNTTDVLEAAGELIYTEGIAYVNAHGDYLDFDDRDLLAITFEGMPVKVGTNGELFVRGTDGTRVFVRVRIVVERDE